MAGPPGRAKPRQRALEALAERGGGDRRALGIADGGGDGLDVARAEGLERRERGAHEVAVLDQRRPVERGAVRAGAGGGGGGRTELAAAVAAAARGAALPGHQGQRPGQRVALAVVALELAEQPDQRVLDAVLGEGGVADQADRVAHRDRPQRMKQRRDRLAVTVRGGDHPAIERGAIDPTGESPPPAGPALRGPPPPPPPPPRRPPRGDPPPPPPPPRGPTPPA